MKYNNGMNALSDAPHFILLPLIFIGTKEFICNERKMSEEFNYFRELISSNLFNQSEKEYPIGRETNSNCVLCI